VQRTLVATLHATFDLTAPRDLTLDVRHIPFWHRLDAILRAFDRLAQGEALELLVDIDPWPLRSYLEATRAVPFHWQYLESGPLTWRVRLRREG
jgi:uncharacterized protein (DUF2249 family)